MGVASLNPPHQPFTHPPPTATPTVGWWRIRTTSTLHKHSMKKEQICGVSKDVTKHFHLLHLSSFTHHVLCDDRDHGNRPDVAPLCLLVPHLLAPLGNPLHCLACLCTVPSRYLYFHRHFSSVSYMYSKHGVLSKQWT